MTCVRGCVYYGGRCKCKYRSRQPHTTAVTIYTIYKWLHYIYYIHTTLFYIDAIKVISIGATTTYTLPPSRRCRQSWLSWPVWRHGPGKRSPSDVRGPSRPNTGAERLPRSALYRMSPWRCHPVTTDSKMTARHII